MTSELGEDILTASEAGAISVVRIEDNPTDATQDCVSITEVVPQMSIVLFFVFVLQRFDAIGNRSSMPVAT